MALEAPMRSSTGNLYFPFNKAPDAASHTDMESLRSPARVVSSPPAADTSSPRPSSFHRVSSNAMTVPSPSDIVGPSPVTSNGTETTEIEDDVSEEVEAQATQEEVSSRKQLLMLSTNLPDSVREAPNEESTSVIHAPESFDSWKSPDDTSRRSSTTSPQSDATSLAALNGTAPRQPNTQTGADMQTIEHPSRPPISTDVNPARYSLDVATPRAQDLGDMLKDAARLRSSSTSSLEKIDEQTENEGDEDDDDFSEALPLQAEDSEITTLRKTLHQCWTLCTTLANLSSIHRARVFSSSHTPDAHERAWQTCWKLCQRLYANQDDETRSLNLRLNLDLCRDFCQALFDVRQRKDESADSVLRVSFELNNHLYSSQDSTNLPDEFQERTLDFYITLCHRLMKQRNDFVDATDHLLRACWNLAEMLFNLRQNRRDGRRPDDELLSSAVQACWELCDIFRHGWTQVRPDRLTPRASQTSFPSGIADQSGRESRTSNRSSVLSKRESVKSGRSSKSSLKGEVITPRQPPHVPETPVTEFEDTPVSPESASPHPQPNIMVLGTLTSLSDGGRGSRWSSNASNLSGYSLGSSRSASTATAAEDPNILRSKILVLRAAMNVGFNRDTVIDPKAGPAILQKFVQSLPTGSFGTGPGRAALLKDYKVSVLTDTVIPRNHPLPPRDKRVSATEMATSVHAMSQSSPRFAYLKELFSFVYQFSTEEAETRRNVSIAV